LVTCLSREDHLWPAVADPRPDGFIVLVDDRGARIVDDGIYATNQARPLGMSRRPTFRAPVPGLPMRHRS
jgi:hypothetical protein